MKELREKLDLILKRSDALEKDNAAELRRQMAHINALATQAKELTNDALAAFWLENYVNSSSLCTLCGNIGLIDTRATARSPAGVYCGRVNFCVCPNGKSLRTHFISAEQCLEDFKDEHNRRVTKP